MHVFECVSGICEPKNVRIILILPSVRIRVQKWSKINKWFAVSQAWNDSIWFRWNPEQIILVQIIHVNELCMTYHMYGINDCHRLPDAIDADTVGNFAIRIDTTFDFLFGFYRTNWITALETLPLSQLIDLLGLLVYLYSQCDPCEVEKWKRQLHQTMQEEPKCQLSKWSPFISIAEESKRDGRRHRAQLNNGGSSFIPKL